MKIAHLIQQLYTDMGGLQVCLHNICNRHALGNVDSHVFCCDVKNKTISTNYKVHPFFSFRAITQLYPLSKYLIIAYVRHLQKKHEFDLWQIYGGYPYGAFLADYFSKNGIPSVLRCSGDDIQINEEMNYGVRRDPKIDAIISENYHKYSAAVAITETVRQEYMNLKIPKETIHLIPNGVDVDWLRRKTTTNIRQKLGLPQNSTVILSVGRNHPKKGYHLIPDILGKVIDHGIDVYWIVIGRRCSEMKKGERFAAFKDRIILIEEIENNAAGHELPPEELVQYYQSADLFAMTSLLETFGIVLIEAMAAGLPVVCFNVPGVRDVMNPDCGIICPENDISAFAGAICQLAWQRGNEQLKNNCFYHAGKYSWDTVSKTYLNLYTKLIN